LVLTVLPLLLRVLRRGLALLRSLCSSALCTLQLLPQLLQLLQSPLLALLRSSGLLSRLLQLLLRCLQLLLQAGQLPQLAGKAIALCRHRRQQRLQLCCILLCLCCMQGWLQGECCVGDGCWLLLLCLCCQPGGGKLWR
jgi:hypothetical protein